MRTRILTVACAFAVLALCGLAMGAVRVYINDFESKSDGSALALAGKDCKAEVRGKKERLGVTTAKGGTRCRLRMPVIGDRPRPDHVVKVAAKLLPKTPDKIRRKVYVGLTVREGSGAYYELRVYPQKRRYSLERKPEDAAFPVSSKDGSIGKTGDKNKLTLRAIGAAVSGKVNKADVAETIDPAADDLEGTRLSLVVGQEGGSKKGASVWFKKLSVEVPKP